jgi:hypothetical protein
VQAALVVEQFSKPEEESSCQIGGFLYYSGGLCNMVEIVQICWRRSSYADETAEIGVDSVYSSVNSDWILGPTSA